MDIIEFLGSNDSINIDKENGTNEETKFVVFRFVPDGTDKREIIKKDKTVVNKL